MVKTSNSRKVFTSSKGVVLSCLVQSKIVSICAPTSAPSHCPVSVRSSLTSAVLSRVHSTRLVLNPYLLSNCTQHQLLLSPRHDCQIRLFLLAYPLLSNPIITPHALSSIIPRASQRSPGLHAVPPIHSLIPTKITYLQHGFRHIVDAPQVFS